jgi:hypothetical protein
MLIRLDTPANEEDPAHRRSPERMFPKPMDSERDALPYHKGTAAWPHPERDSETDFQDVTRGRRNAHTPVECFGRQLLPASSPTLPEPTTSGSAHIGPSRSRQAQTCRLACTSAAPSMVL